MKTYTIGLDIAKSVFQVHVEDAAGRVVMQRRRRAQVERLFTGLPSSLVALEACGAAHHWGRRLRALGHEVRLIPAASVRPFVRRNKTDARDAAAICAALKHPDMRFVALKSAEQQASRGLERSRELLVRQHTQLANSVRGQLAAHGLVAAQGRRGFAQLAALLAIGDERIPTALVPVLRLLLEQIARLAAAIAQLEDRIVAAARSDPAMRRLATIPGIGPIVAHAVVAAVGDGRQFRSARDFAAWAGLTPQGARQRRQTTHQRHQPTGRPPPAHAVRARRQHGEAHRPRARRPRHRLAARHPGTPAGEGGGAGAGRQDRAHRLGRARLRRGLPAAAAGAHHRAA